VRKAIQASIFRTLGFDIGFTASAMASDAVFDELSRFGVETSPMLKLVGSDPIEELNAEPPPWSGDEELL
jgi:hypothetical protein